MTPEQTARFFKLRKKSKTSAGLTGPEDVEYEELMSDRHAEVMDMIPLPTCCEAVRTHPAVVFTVDYGDGDSHKSEGRWYIAKHQELMHQRSAADPQYYRQPVPEPKFCPYCGTALPKMVRKNPIPKTVCQVTDGGYYCATCRERLNCCLCDPLSSAFEPEQKA